MNNNFTHSIIGKIVGGIIGVLLLGPFGLIVGMLLGHLYDRRAASWMPQQRSQQDIFLHHLFALLGFMAKADGQVSQAEIDYTKKVMKRLNLNNAQCEQAMRSFYEGKNEGFDWIASAKTIKQISGLKHQRWLYVVMNAQVQMAYADGVVKDLLKPILQRIASILGLPALNFTYYDAIFGWQEFYQKAWQQQQQFHQQSYSQQGYSAPRKSSMSLSEAYALLGMNDKADEVEIKKAYRKMMSKYHPDKLMSKGLSDKEMQQATEKVQKIQAAYEQIREARRF